MSNPQFVTTVAMSLEVRAGLDGVKATRAQRHGKRPTTRDLIIEALEQFLEREAGPESTAPRLGPAKVMP